MADRVPASPDPRVRPELLDGPGLAAFPAQAAAVVLLARGCRAAAGGTPTPLGTGGAVAGVQTAGLLAVFLHVSAGNWAFMPDPVGPFTRGRAALFLLLAGALLPAAALARERDGSERPTDDGPADAMTVMTFNVHQYLDSDGDYNLRAVRDLIATSGADVVGLQETAGGRLTSGGLDGVRWLAHELGYRYHAGAPTSLQSYGVALLSRWPVRNGRVVELPRRDTATRIALGATVESPLGDVPVVVAHLETEGDVRIAQAERVVRLAEATGPRDRAVVLGDFNATPDERPYAVLAGAFADPWADSGGAGDTYSASDPRRRIDYVFAGTAWGVRRGEVLGSPDVSDHLAVTAAVTRE